MTPAISVCIPTHNGAAYIGQTLKSVLAQSGIELEVIVADDASSDDTVEQVIALDDPRIRLLRASVNLGPEGNWNRALDAARGDYVKVMGQDDLLYDGCLADQAAVLGAERGVALVASRRDVVDGTGRAVVRSRGLAGMRGVVAPDRAVRAVVRSGTNPIGEPVAVLFSREARAAAGGFRGGLPYVIDLDYWCRLLDAGSLYAMAQTLCAFRVSTGSWSAKLAKEQSAQVRKLYAGLRDRRPNAITAADVALGSAKAAAAAVARRALYRTLPRDPEPVPSRARPVH